MTAPIESSAQAAPTPVGVRIASTLAIVVGVLTLLVALAVGLPQAAGEEPQLFTLLVGAVSGAGIALGGAMLWRRQRAGVLVIVTAWAGPIVGAPIVGALIVGEPAHGNLLITGALLLAAANWKQLR